ncbi:hypothetical protein CH313_14495 [Streptomyces sp. TSRI0384-2]|uniref:hypothetical protein n=1 Tax=Streptomyces TaxID=1883 RepID=UPI000C26A301|nr:hypothetical protein [Streptomyces sp. TSRI0384-2]PJM83149.1 hypothetical protein CH313_14495 [Streptomyces sp. TSRI0384-2]
MKLKHIGLVAAMAVVGPASLAAAPASAQGAGAVTAPWAVPGAEAGEEDTPAEATEEGTATAVTAEPHSWQSVSPDGEGSAPEPDGSEANEPATQARSPELVDPGRPEAADPAPATVPSTPVPQHARASAEQPAAAQSRPGFRIGPQVSADGVPESFTPGGPAEFTVTVDNTGNPGVPHYAPSVAVSDTTDRFEPGHFTAEVRGEAGDWTQLTAHYEPGSGHHEIALPASAVGADEVRSLDVRITFVEHAPELWFEVAVSGQGMDENGSVVSGTLWYQTRVGTGEDGGEHEEAPVNAGPPVTLEGVPADGFTAGADWTELAVRADNTGLEAVEEYTLALNLVRLPGQGDWFGSTQVEFEVYGPRQDGTEGWQPLDAYTAENLHAYGVGALPLAADEQREVRLRVRFAADVPSGPVALTTFGWQSDESSEEALTSEPRNYVTRVREAVTEGGTDSPDDGEPHAHEPGDGGQPQAGEVSEDGPGAEEPHPVEGEQWTPRPDGTGDGGSSAGGGSGVKGGAGARPATAPQAVLGMAATPLMPAGAQLAATGGDPATTWAVGGAALTVAVGAALLVNGRRRAPSSR